MRVIDSSTLIKYFSREPGWERAREIISEGIMTLDLAIKEVANALWRKVLYNEMPVDVAIEIIKDLVENKPFPVKRQEEYLIEAFEIATREKTTVYDALFIALAKKTGLELVTSDLKQAEIARKMGIKVIVV